jgi:hypothetical protein
VSRSETANAATPSATEIARGPSPSTRRIRGRPYSPISLALFTWTEHAVAVRNDRFNALEGSVAPVARELEEMVVAVADVDGANAAARAAPASMMRPVRRGGCRRRSSRRLVAAAPGLGGRGRSNIGPARARGHCGSLLRDSAAAAVADRCERATGGHQQGLEESSIIDGCEMLLGSWEG